MAALLESFSTSATVPTRAARRRPVRSNRSPRPVRSNRSPRPVYLRVVEDGARVAALETPFEPQGTALLLVPLAPALVSESASRAVPEPERHALSVARREHRHHRRQLASVVATLACLSGLYVGASALRSAGRPGLAVVAGSVKLATGDYLYRVRPGDTLWSIATQLEPTGDPRPLVDQLSAQLHGATLEPGVVLRLP